LNTIIQFRRGTAAEWTAVNPVLAAGEVGYETDTGKIKVGNGSSLWTALGYSSEGPTGATGATGPTGPQGDFSLAQTIEAKNAAYTIQSSDAGKLLTMDGTFNFTVSSETALSSGQRVDILNVGTGTVSVTQGSGATVTANPGRTLRGRWSVATLLCLSENTYVLMGDLRE